MKALSENMDKAEAGTTGQLPRKKALEHGQVHVVAQTYLPSSPQSWRFNHHVWDKVQNYAIIGFISILIVGRRA